MLITVDNRPKCSQCNEAPADVIEYDYLLSCADCWNEKNIPANERNGTLHDLT